MPRQEILEEFRKLAPAERLVVIVAALQELRGELQPTRTAPTTEERKRQLASAAEALFADCAADGELTGFSVLDAEADRAHHGMAGSLCRCARMVQILPTPENGLDKLSAADTFQVRSLAHQRFVRKMGHLSDAVMRSISQALAELNTA